MCWIVAHISFLNNIIAKYTPTLTSPYSRNLKMVPFTYRGLAVPVFTPFNYDVERSLNLKVIPEYARYLNKVGVTGIVVGATSGEGPSMNVNERKLLTEAWSKACKETKQHLMIQVGGAPLPDVIELARHAEKIKVDSILCLPELYTKPKTITDLVNYLQIVAEAAPNTHLLYYHIPAWTHVNIHMGKFFQEAHTKIPTLAGVKYSSLDLYEGMDAVLAFNKKYGVFLGGDMVMAGASALGFDSAIAITLNIFPRHLPQIVQFINEGNIQMAQQVQEDLNKATDIVTKNATWVPAVKAAMSFMIPLDLGPPRAPLTPISTYHLSEMKEDLKNAKYL